MATQKLNLTRDQLATFLKNHDQIKQFEKLFEVVDTISDGQPIDLSIAIGTAQSTANDALAQIASLSQSTGITDAVIEAKTQQAMDSIAALNGLVELLISAPVRNNVALSHDVNGMLPYANQTKSVRSNQVLTWLTM